MGSKWEGGRTLLGRVIKGEVGPAGQWAKRGGRQRRDAARKEVGTSPGSQAGSQAGSHAGGGWVGARRTAVVYWRVVVEGRAAASGRGAGGDRRGLSRPCRLPARRIRPDQATARPARRSNPLNDSVKRVGWPPPGVCLGRRPLHRSMQGGVDR